MDSNIRAKVDARARGFTVIVGHRRSQRYQTRRKMSPLADIGAFARALIDAAQLCHRYVAGGINRQGEIDRAGSGLRGSRSLPAHNLPILQEQEHMVPVTESIRPESTALELSVIA